MDAKDKKILTILQHRGREQISTIAKEIGLSNAAVHARVIKLEKTGILTGYKATIDAEKLGKNTDILMKIIVDHKKDDPENTIPQILQMKQVISVLTLTGEWDYHIRMKLKSVAELRKVTTKIIKEIVPHIIRSDTAVIMSAHEKPLEP